MRSARPFRRVRYFLKRMDRTNAQRAAATWKNWLCLYLAIASVYVLTSSGRIAASDGLAMYNVTRSLATQGNFSADPCEPNAMTNDCVPGVDGKHYAGFGLLPSIAAVPAFLVGKWTAARLHRDSQLVTGLTITLFHALVSAAVPIVLASWLWILGFSWISAASAALVLAFASPVWHYGTKWFSSEPYFALLLLGCCCLLALSRNAPQIFAAGLLFGLSSGCRIYGLILAPAFLIYGWLIWRRRGASQLGIVKRVCLFCGATAAIVGLIALSNWTRFGSVWKTGYQLLFPTASALLSTPFWFGARGLLINGEVGFLIFVPWALVVPFLLRPFWRRYPDETVLILSLVFINFVFFAKYAAWHGGTAIGPRMLQILIPCLLPVLSLMLESGCRPPGRFLALLAAVTVMLALTVQLILVPYPDIRYYILRSYDDSHGRAAWWNRRPIFKIAADLPVLFSRADRHPVDPAEQTLLQVPNSVNLVRPDLWILKAAILGVPRMVVAPIALLLLLAAIVGFRRAFDQP